MNYDFSYVLPGPVGRYLEAACPPHDLMTSALCHKCHGRLASVNMLSSLLSDCTGPGSGSPVTSLYLTASILLMVGLCIPWTHSPAACVWARLLLSLSHLALAAWAYSDLCSVQLFCWHMILFLVSVAKFSEVRSLSL